MDKKGVSSVVTTVLIILIILVLIGIIWIFFGNFILQSGDETTNAPECYTPSFTIESCEYGEYISEIEDSNGLPIPQSNTKPIIVKLKRNQGAGNIQGIALQAIDAERSYVIKDPSVKPKEFESVNKVFLFPSATDFLPSRVNLFFLVGEKRKLCRGPPAATISCTCHPFPANLDGDINCDGALNGFDIEFYAEVYRINEGRFVQCDYASTHPAACAGNTTALTCPDLDGDGIVRELDLAIPEKWVSNDRGQCGI